jgi:prefoldin subunit 5
MTPFDNKIALMNRLLEEMSYLGRRLDELQNKVSENGDVIETLRAENRRYRDLLAVLPQRVFLKDERLHYILCSEMFASDLDKAIDEVIGKVEENLVPLELAKHRRQQEMRILQSGQAEEVEEILIIDGQQKAFITIKAPLKNHDGRVWGIFGVSVDISPYWRRLAELESLTQQMENMLAGQSQQIVSLQSNLEYVISSKRQMEEECRELRVDYEKQLLLKNIEFMRLKNELQRQPAVREEILETLQRKVRELQNFIDVAEKYMDRSRKAPDE